MPKSTGRKTQQYLPPSKGRPRALKTSERVALEIVQDIVEHGRQPGDRLPLESEMLTQYRVSRSSLREALRLLETQGLLAIRPGAGAGTVVCEPEPSDLGRTMTLYFHMANVSYDELLDTWKMMEPLVAELAARNPDEAARRLSLEPYLSDSFRASPEQKAVPAGKNFHSAVAKLTGNRALELVSRAIGSIVSEHILLLKSRVELETFIIDDHAQLAQAIVDGRAALARELMADHVGRVVVDFCNFWPQKVGQRVRWE
jgi:GntR family transcriptional repressor for pyruvate dehydrogenase complex